MIGSPSGSDAVGAAEPADLADFSELRAQLHQVARSLDALWRESLASATGQHLAMCLGGASHGVHRALIALEDDFALTAVHP